MPHEDRRLVFDYTETYKAIFSLCIQKNIEPPPPGTILSIEENSGNSQEFKITIDNHHREGNMVSANYSRDFIAAALMLYCRSCGIPLPKKARKSVLTKDSAVILHIAI